MIKRLAITAGVVVAAQTALAVPKMDVVTTGDAQGFGLVADGAATPVVVDGDDYPAVKLTAALFADDVNRVTGVRPAVGATANSKQAILVGTLGHSKIIDKLAADGKLPGVDGIKGQWETTLWEVVDKPMPGVDRALVIVGSDRRGTAYGLTTLSEKIGVSPWYWWADVPVTHRDVVAVKIDSPQTDHPAVKYRGIFINDEDWGLNVWASKTFDPDLKNIGPKTYEKVFELMLRLRLNTIWPAMHPCTKEFASIPENAQLADKFGIVAGASHCEPMLCNNIRWNEKTQGKWDYAINSDAIHNYWEDSAKKRGQYEAVWTIGIRGIHDSGMEGPKDTPTRLKTMTAVLADQKKLIKDDVTGQFGPVAQCFVPYKEVQPIYDAGLAVPDDVTLVWADDNFGYIRRLSSPDERKRPGGAGVYYHLSYYGPPHSYTWINTTAPALMWEQLHKAYDNDAKTLWMLNVGDIKPAEIGISYYAKLAWDADTVGPDSQPAFLRDFAAGNFGEAVAQPMADLLADFYRLGTIRKPELMQRAWAMSLAPDEAAVLAGDYRKLAADEAKLAATIPLESRDAYYEIVGFPARVLADSGLLFMADREAQLDHNATANAKEVDRLREELGALVTRYNKDTAAGKWNNVMSGLMTGKTINAWNSQVRWPWGDAPRSATAKAIVVDPENRTWRPAASADRRDTSGPVHWTAVAGLGSSGQAMTLQPAGLFDESTNRSHPPSLSYDFTCGASPADVLIDFMPTFRMYPGMKLQVSVSIDNAAAAPIEVPGSSGTEDERGQVRQQAVQNNSVRVTLPLPNLPAGKHTLTIMAMDPGVVIDRISLP